MNANAHVLNNALPSEPPGCGVEAFGVMRLPFDEIARLRKNPGPSLGSKIPVSMLKHADHQTLLGLAAILKAAQDCGWQEHTFADWGVIAAPRFLGRTPAAAAIDRFQTMGVSGMSPIIIPTLSLHAPAGSLSLAIKSHGFNYGVGGGPGHLTEALLAGLAAQDDGDVPGVWVVATGFDPEPIPDVAGNSLVPSFGYAVALALVAKSTGKTRLNLRIVPTAVVDLQSQAMYEHPSLAELAEFLSDSDPGLRPRRWFGAIPGGGAFEIEDDPGRGIAANDHCSSRAS